MKKYNISVSISFLWKKNEMKSFFLFADIGKRKNER